MARWTDIAEWRGNSPNHSSRNGTKVTGFVVHTAGGNGSGVVNWIMNPKSRVSSTFVVMKSGKIYQTLDTSLRPWTTGNANPYTISVETEGYFNEPFTQAQLDALGRILKKANQVYGVKLTLDRRNGLSAHRDHMSTSCPGNQRYSQMTDIVAAAKGSSVSAPKPTPTKQPAAKTPTTKRAWDEELIRTMGTVRRGTTGANARRVQALLIANGGTASSQVRNSGGIDGTIGTGSERAIKTFQKAKKITVDGVCGPQTWARLLKG